MKLCESRVPDSGWLLYQATKGIEPKESAVEEAEQLSLVAEVGLISECFKRVS